MIQAAKRLENILQEIPAKLLRYSEEISSQRPAPGKWSKKEILGHLIDSASNNHQRFVRMQIDNQLTLPTYKQNEWVALQQYQELKWVEIVEFWKLYNTQLLHVLKKMDESKLSNEAVVGDYGKSVSLQFLVDDYVDHMEHHLKQILS